MALQGLLGLERNPAFGVQFGREDDIKEKIEALKNVNYVDLPIGPTRLGEQITLRDTVHGRRIEFRTHHGTTTFAFKYAGGIIAAVDSRATGGSLISSVVKVIEVTKHILTTMSGGAADCAYWSRVIAARARLYELRNKERISVAAASKLLANTLFSYKGMGLSIGTMVVGHDKKGASIYFVSSDGARLKGESFSSGSGSLYAYGVFDSYYRYDMTDEEAFELGRRIIFHAAHRDCASGGIVRVVHLTQEGYRFVSNVDGKELYYQYHNDRVV